jgi:ParB-like chromosome segregation protein Spo0J
MTRHETVVGQGYALAFDWPLSTLRTALDDGPVSLSELGRSYQHMPAADLTRVRLHEKTDDPELWLITAAARVLSRWLDIDGDVVRYKDGVTGNDLRYQGKKVSPRLVEAETPYALAHAKFGDPFNLQSGRFAENIRDPGDLTELRESMKAHGWVKEFPAIEDEWGVVLVGNRRMLVARELGIAPVVVTVRLGDGDHADAERLKLAIVSNIASKPFTKNERQRLADYLYNGHDWSQQKVAEALHVDQKTISRDLQELGSMPKSGGRGRPRKQLPPQTQKAFEAAKEYAEKTGEMPTKAAVMAVTGLGDTPVRHGLTAFEAVESQRADETDHYRLIIEDATSRAQRPMTRAEVVDLQQALQKRLDSEAQR